MQFGHYSLMSNATAPMSIIMTLSSAASTLEFLYKNLCLMN